MTEAEKSSPKRRPLSKQERSRKIKAIYHELEAKKRELGLRAPMIKRGPVFYAAMLVVLLLIGGLVIQAAGKGGGKKMRDGNIVRAEQSVSALAEALGRFKFHCGVYPTDKEGLSALSDKFSTHAGWIGPYAERILPDPWKHPYVYEPTNDPPVVLSLGPDGVRGTADDIAPDPELFAKPFKDTSWTNDWVYFSRRGIVVVPTQEEKEKLLKEGMRDR